MRDKIPFNYPIVLSSVTPTCEGCSGKSFQRALSPSHPLLKLKYQVLTVFAWTPLRLFLSKLTGDLLPTFRTSSLPLNTSREVAGFPPSPFFFFLGGEVGRMGDGQTWTCMYCLRHTYHGFNWRLEGNLLTNGLCSAQSPGTCRVHGYAQVFYKLWPRAIKLHNLGFFGNLNYYASTHRPSRTRQLYTYRSVAFVTPHLT